MNIYVCKKDPTHIFSEEDVIYTPKPMSYNAPAAYVEGGKKMVPTCPICGELHPEGFQLLNGESSNKESKPEESKPEEPNPQANLTPAQATEKPTPALTTAGTTQATTTGDVTIKELINSVKLNQEILVELKERLSGVIHSDYLAGVDARIKNNRGIIERL